MFAMKIASFFNTFPATKKHNLPGKTFIKLRKRCGGFQENTFKKKMDGQLSFEYSLQVNTILIPPHTSTLKNLRRKFSVHPNWGSPNPKLCAFSTFQFTVSGVALHPCWFHGFLSKPSTHTSCLVLKRKLMHPWSMHISNIFIYLYTHVKYCKFYTSPFQVMKVPNNIY